MMFTPCNHTKSPLKWLMLGVNSVLGAFFSLHCH